MTTPAPIPSLEGKKIILGVTGSIAAYKAAEITSQLRKRGAEIFPVMTAAAQKFITPLTLQTLARNPVAADLWDEGNSWQPGHIELADKADLMLVAPATADVIAQFAHGLAPDYLSSMYLVCRAPVLIAPAMNCKMWTHPATAANVATLKTRGVEFIGPEEGALACGYEGIGRLWPVGDIVGRVETMLGASGGKPE
ncbi:phosphopantothenoylcysteine decarboxylase [Ereboglobus sp. PH5-10]|uniref:flavoprotein n=1 Tax=Ereboglobus sp. PH5-10 TaxID=2940629 RepID=UPI00240662D4|nr:flavoprotein [Ereboglobus sp. PH5-10]MDF9827237.1 phosphopantothenoylcysteine decarboxylase [Ereboglobus sp. PH5-10]